MCCIWSCGSDGNGAGQFAEIDPDGWAYGAAVDFRLAPDNAALFPDISFESVSEDSTFTADSSHTVTDSLHHAAPIEGSARIALTVCHSDAYPYSNLWLEASYATGDTIVADTFNLLLADDYGRWFGNGMGIDFQFCDTVTTRFRPNGGATLSVRHIMRVEKLPEIFKIGVKELH